MSLTASTPVLILRNGGIIAAYSACPLGQVPQKVSRIKWHGKPTASLSSTFVCVGSSGTEGALDACCPARSCRQRPRRCDDLLPHGLARMGSCAPAAGRQGRGCLHPGKTVTWARG
eukprot:1153286-Pelagomonas_calceolata.AAC.4